MIYSEKCDKSPSGWCVFQRGGYCNLPAECKLKQGVDSE
jgi:hypothetical protein